MNRETDIQMGYNAYCSLKPHTYAVATARIMTAWQLHALLFHIQYTIYD